MSATEEWIRAWSAVQERDFHPCDLPVLAEVQKELESSRRRDRRLYAECLTAGIGNGCFHRKLGAIPYVGRLRHARIFLLMLNPGVCHGDYQDKADPRANKTFTANLLQEDVKTCFAVEEDGPKGWSPYYRKRVFGRLVKDLCCDAIRETLKSRLAILELVPYFSCKACLIRGYGISDRLWSSQLARASVQEIVSDDRNLIVPRWPLGLQDWRLQASSDKAKVLDPSPWWGLSNQAISAIRAKLDEITLEHSNQCPNRS